MPYDLILNSDRKLTLLKPDSDDLSESEYYLYRMGLPEALPAFDSNIHKHSEQLHKELASILLSFNIGGKPANFGTLLTFMPSPKLKDSLYLGLAQLLNCPANDVFIIEGRTIRYLYDWTKIQLCRQHHGRFHGAESGWGFNALDYPNAFMELVSTTSEAAHVIYLDTLTYSIVPK